MPLPRAPLAHLVWILVVLSAPMALHAQQPAPLRLVIEAERSSVTLGEPVYVTARVRNQGTIPARLIPLLDPSDGLLVVSVSGPHAERLGFVPLNVRDNDAAPAELAPGAQIAAAFPVFFGASGWTMRAPGTYTLRARFTIHDGSGHPREINSETLSIRVGDQPAGLDRVLLSGNGPSLQAGKFLLWAGGDHLAEGQALLASLPAQFKDAAVVDHYRLALGRSMARPFKDYARGTVRTANHERAVAELEQVRDDVLPTFLRVQKHIALATSYRALGRVGEATRATAAARALIGERVELTEFREQLDRVGTNPPPLR